MNLDKRVSIYLLNLGNRVILLFIKKTDANSRTPN